MKAEPADQAALETKFNPYHDPENGRFTFAPGGPQSRRSVVTSWGKYKPKAVKPKKPQTVSGRHIDVPVSPTTKPIDRVPTERHPDGSITVDIPPASEQSEGRKEPDIVVTARKEPQARSYALKTPDIVVTSSIKSQVEAVGSEFRRQTGKVMVVTSSLRSPHKQADAMYGKFEAGADGSDYKNRKALTEVRDAYLRGKAAGKAREEIVTEMADMVSRQVENGTYLSRHLSGRAVDIRLKGLTRSEYGILKNAVRSAGGNVHYEGSPLHLHVQF